LTRPSSKNVSRKATKILSAEQQYGFGWGDVAVFGEEEQLTDMEKD
jgi:hypothetical protein